VCACVRERGREGGRGGGESTRIQVQEGIAAALALDPHALRPPKEYIICSKVAPGCMQLHV